ncbi:MAG: hypothetical protein EOP41_03885 [Sphingobacteriaceae bacterium]|nr:MAG: hypothetical protein EOP41_03885 [Sphingobacteriaceae bacterium]
MNLKYALAGVAIVAASQVSRAQSVFSSDAYRFSQGQNGSTSRIKAIGGASTAVGGDLSSISNNPAGIGFFTKSELSITPEFNNSQVKSSYFGTSNYSGKNQINLNNASVVFYNRLSTPRGRDKTKGWLSFNLGASYNRTNNFYRNERYSGVNPNGSISDYYAQEAYREIRTYGNFDPTDNTLQSWANYQGLIRSPSTNQFQSTVSSQNNPQSNNTVTTGGQSELNLSAGANYSNKLYLGFGIGITSLRFNSTRTFDESGLTTVPTNTGTASTPFASQFYQDQATIGTGFNARLGFIYKPVEAVRIGASFTTPTWMTVNDSYVEALQTATGQSQPIYNGVNQPYETTYNLRTPLKANVGVAVFAGKYGFITGDIEYVDYKGTHLSGSYGADAQDNLILSTQYQSTVNAKIGAEAKLDDFFLRGGFNYQGNPQVGIGGPVKTSSAGIGYRFGKYYVDATYQYVTRNTTVYPYEFDRTIFNIASPSADLKNIYNNAFLTLGMRF